MSADLNSSTLEAVFFKYGIVMEMSDYGVRLRRGDIEGEWSSGETCQIELDDCLYMAVWPQQADDPREKALYRLHRVDRAVTRYQFTNWEVCDECVTWEELDKVPALSTKTTKPA